MTKVEACALSDGALLSGWTNRPLCRRYILGIFDVAVVRSRDADGGRDLQVHWAIGWLSDGECDFLGAWIEPESSAESPLRMLADLKARGVERIWHVAGPGMGNLQERVGAAFSSTTVGSAVDSLLTEALAGLQGRSLPALVLVAEQVRAGLMRAIRRHGRFDSEAATLDFVAAALQRAERRLERERVMATAVPRPDPVAQAVPPGF